jgi:quinolinate synthase
MQELKFSPAVEKETAHVYERISRVIDEKRWQFVAPYIVEINRLKKERNAVILAHNYQTPDIFYGVADIVGDSLKLAQEATKTTADIIVQAGVYFMAETAKILNPDKMVLIPDTSAGCSLATSITPDDVALMRAKYPNATVVSYVNTNADVKAVSDICVTSGNAEKIVEAIDSDEIIFLPDQYLANYVATKTKKKIYAWKGACEVHERFTGAYIRELRAEHKGITILAHPECPPDVLLESDYVGSTAQMSNYIDDKQPQRVVLITECSMSDNVYASNPNLEFIRPCQLCPHMQRIDLPKILHSLQTLTHQVEIDADISKRARRAIDRMLELS